MAQFEIAVTETGRALLAASIGGQAVTFTRMALGDGTYTGDLSGMEEMISPRLSLDVAQVSREDNQVRIRAVMGMDQLETPFYWRELGVFAEDAAGQEFLAVYGNAGGQGDYLTSQDGVLEEREFVLSIFVEQDEVVAELSGVLFASQSQLNAHVENEDIHVTNGEKVHTLTHSKSGTTHYLTGLSGVSGTVSCVFRAAADFQAGDSIQVDGTSCTIQLSNGETAEDGLFVSGATVAVIVDTEGKKVNFKSGGGVSSAKLALADAEEGDVASGKTFYAGDKSLKTGTFVGYQYITGTVDVPVRISSERAYLYPPFSPKIFIGKVLSGGHDGGGIVNMQAPFSFKLSYQRGDWQSGEDAYSVVFYSDGSIGVSVVYDGSAEEANMQYIILG